MKKVVLILTALILVTLSTSAFADEEFLVPKYNGKFVGITINKYGNPSNGKSIIFKSDINRKVKKAINKYICSPSKSSEDNVEFSEDLMTSQNFTNIQFISGTFQTLEDGFYAAMISSKPDYYGLLIFDQKARKEVSLDVIFSVKNGKTVLNMAIGHCGNTYGLVRTLNESDLQSAFESGRKSAEARADREAAEEAAATQPPYEPSVDEVTSEGGIIVTSSF